MEIEKLQLIKRNDTVETLLRLFASSNQISNVTNVESFSVFLQRKGNEINPVDYMNFFKDLQTAGIGFLTNYNGKSFTKFLWNYSMKDVSEQILYPNRMIKIRPAIEEPIEEETVIPQEKNMEIKRRGRPKGSRNLSKPQISEENSTEKEVPKRKGRPKVLYSENNYRKEIVFMFTTSKGKVLPFELQDAEKLLQQVEQIKSQIA